MNDPRYPLADPHDTPYQRLALAVIDRAVVDLLQALRARQMMARQTPNPDRHVKWYLSDAARFLFATHGPAADAREFWAQVAGLDVLYIQGKVREAVQALWGAEMARHLCTDPQESLCRT